MDDGALTQRIGQVVIGRSFSVRSITLRSSERIGLLDNCSLS